MRSTLKLYELVGVFVVLCAVVVTLEAAGGRHWAPHSVLFNIMGGERERRKNSANLGKQNYNVKHTNGWYDALCGKWDDWCMPTSHKPGLTCCKGYTCKCNLWNTNCRCLAKLFGSG